MSFGLFHFSFTCKWVIPANHRVSLHWIDNKRKLNKCNVTVALSYSNLDNDKKISHILLMFFLNNLYDYLIRIILSKNFIWTLMNDDFLKKKADWDEIKSDLQVINIQEITCVNYTIHVLLISLSNENHN